MNINEILKWFDNNVTITILGALTLIQIAPIRIDPWTWIFQMLQKFLGISEIKDILMDHIIESNRMTILDFANACMNGRRHTEEEFKKIIKICDWYEDYVETNKIKNGEVTEAIVSIREIYHRRKLKNDFLTQKED